MPADAVALGEGDGGRWPPCSRRIGSGSHALFSPRGTDLVDPRPLCLDLVTADEQGGIAFDEVEQKPLISDPAPIFAEGIGETEVKRHFAEANPLAVQSWRLRHQPEFDRFFRLQTDDQLVRLGRRST